MTAVPPTKTPTANLTLRVRSPAGIGASTIASPTVESAVGQTVLMAGEQHVPQTRRRWGYTI